MYKPNGYARVCTAAEVDSVVSSWNSVLCWLRDADPNRPPESHDVAHVACNAAQQSRHFPDYDIRTWRKSAIDVPLTPCPSVALPLPALGYDLYINLGLERLRSSRRWLNRVAVEMLYGREPSFNEHRGLLVPLLLDGPVQLDFWAGQRIPLAHATKFVVRHVLSPEKVTNLLHLSRLTSTDASALEAACDLGVVEG